MAKVSFYFDEMMSRKAADQLLKRGYQVILAPDVDMRQKDDDTEHLPYASSKNLVLVTFDCPFAGRTMHHSDHAGLICLTGSPEDIGYIVRILSEFADTHTPEEAQGQVFWL